MRGIKGERIVAALHRRYGRSQSSFIAILHASACDGQSIGGSHDGTPAARRSGGRPQPAASNRDPGATAAAAADAGASSDSADGFARRCIAPWVWTCPGRRCSVRATWSKCFPNATSSTAARYAGAGFAAARDYAAADDHARPGARSRPQRQRTGGGHDARGPERADDDRHRHQSVVALSGQNLPGGGHVMVNVGTGNLVLQDDDMDVPHKGIALAFRRTYNSQSLHDVNGDEGGVFTTSVGMYGNGWTNTLTRIFFSYHPAPQHTAWWTSTARVMTTLERSHQPAYGGTGRPGQHAV